MSRSTQDRVRIPSCSHADDVGHGSKALPSQQRPSSRRYEQRKLRIREECGTDPRPWTSPAKIHSDSRLSAGSSRSSLNQTNKIQNWLSQKAVQNVQEKADPEAKVTKQMYMSVLDTENTFVRDVDNFLLHKAFLDLRRKEMLHKKWTERIGDPVQARIFEEMKRSYPRLDKQKRRLYEEYLRHGNKKGSVFLDTFDTTEYDPLELVAPRPAPMRIHVRTNSDPLLIQQRTRDDGDNTILACRTGETLTAKELENHRLPPLPLVPLGRHGTGCNTWLAMPLHNIESPVRLMSRFWEAIRTISDNGDILFHLTTVEKEAVVRRMHGAFNNSEIDFSIQSSMPQNPGTIEHKMKFQKRRSFMGPPLGQETLAVNLSPTNSQQDVICPY